MWHLISQIFRPLFHRCILTILFHRRNPEIKVDVFILFPLLFFLTREQQMKKQTNKKKSSLLQHVVLPSDCVTLNMISTTTFTNCMELVWSNFLENSPLLPPNIWIAPDYNFMPAPVSANLWCVKKFMLQAWAMIQNHISHIQSLAQQLTDVGVLQETADTSLSLQLLMVWGEKTSEFKQVAEHHHSHTNAQ